jgi:hypothetical protein
MARKKHARTKGIDSKMTPGESRILSIYGDLWVPFAQMYGLIYETTKGKEFPDDTPAIMYPQEIAGLIVTLKNILAVAILNGDTSKITQLVQAMEFVHEGSSPRSPILAALADFKAAMNIENLYRAPENSSPSDRKHWADIRKDPAIVKMFKRLRTLKKEMPMTVTGYRRYIAETTGKEHPTQSVRVALKQLGIPIKKEAGGRKKKAT